MAVKILQDGCYLLYSTEYFAAYISCKDEDRDRPNHPPQIVSPPGHDLHIASANFGLYQCYP